MKQKMNLFTVIYNYGHNKITYMCLLLILGTVCIDVYDTVFETSISTWEVSIATYIVSLVLIIVTAYFEKYLDELDSKYIIRDIRHYNRTHRRFRK